MTIEYKSTKTIFDILEKKLISDRFLNMEGIIAEAPYYICPYDPADEQIWERNGNDGKEKTNHIKQLANRVKREKGVKCLCVDLYKDVMLKVLEEKGLWEKVLSMEETFPKERLAIAMKGALDPNKSLVPKITSLLEEGDYRILLIYGVGAVYPFIRAHNLIACMQSRITNIPVVIFFPGKYESSESKGIYMTLFGKLEGNNFYRAINITGFD